VAGNQVTLTLAGDADSMQRAIDQASRATNELEQDMDSVGAEARSMASQVGSSEDAFEGLARSSGQLGEALDRASGGFSMLSGGIGDVGGALTAFTDMQNAAEQATRDQEAANLAAEQAQIDYNAAVSEFGANSLEARTAALALEQAKSDAEPPTAVEEWGAKLELLSPIIMGVVGATDLMILANMIAQASWVRTAASMVAARTAMVASAVATGIATAAQWLWNAAMTANPIGIIIVAIAALVAGIIWVATQTTWFQTIWEYVWGAIVAYVEWVVGNYQKAIGVVVAGFEWLVTQIRKVPGLIGSALSTVYNIVTAPFRLAFNAVSSMWNRTVGRLSWTVPGWVPGIGGNTISAPRLPSLHSGGRVPGTPGQNVLAMLQAGETVGSSSASGGGATQIVIRSDGGRVGAALVELLAGALRSQGGLEVALGG
jgi:hypothetical protein